MLGPLVLFAVAALAARVANGGWPDLSRFGAGRSCATGCLTSRSTASMWPAWRCSRFTHVKC
jgi:hypothetical protein